MKLWRRDQLLAQIGRGVDQEPVLAVRADGNRGLRASKFGMLGSCRPAHRTPAIPLRNTAACRRAQDDDAKHDPPLLEMQKSWRSNVSSSNALRARTSRS